MDNVMIIKMIAGLLFVCGLILLISLIVKKYAAAMNFPTNKRNFIIKDNLYINDRNRVVLIQGTTEEYILLLSRDGNVLLGNQALVKNEKLNEI